MAIPRGKGMTGVTWEAAWQELRSWFEVLSVGNWNLKTQPLPETLSKTKGVKVKNTDFSLPPSLHSASIAYNWLNIAFYEGIFGRVVGRISLLVIESRSEEGKNGCGTDMS